MPDNNHGNLSYLQTDGSFDDTAFLRELDTLLNREEDNATVKDYLLQAAADAENAGDDAGLLTVLNEIMGYYRSHGYHKDNMWMVQRSLELAIKMHLEGTEAWTTTLINAATSMRAAGQYEQSEDLYEQALSSAQQSFQPNDRRLAALHNNLSMLYSETGRIQQALDELKQALDILTASSPDPTCDVDIASTHANMALILLELQKMNTSPTTVPLLTEAQEHAFAALQIYETGHLQDNPHYASTLASHGQTCYSLEEYGKAAGAYQAALNIISRQYGFESDAYVVTANNLNQARQAAEENHQIVEPISSAMLEATAQEQTATTTHATLKNSINSGSTPMSRPPIKGLELSRKYWEQHGKPLLEERYPQYVGRIAAGLVGHGSECYGFDDSFSQDHDFGPGFCFWLTQEDYKSIGQQLQADYDSLPQVFMGYGPRKHTARATGSNKRVGVFEIGDFFNTITGFPKAPPQNSPHEWLILEEATLSAATNGEVFADPLGVFLQTRQDFQTMPDDVRFSLISRRLGMISQSGQYNLHRMLERGDGAAAWLSINEFVKATASLIFLLNNPLTVGYLPYYKWQFAALRQISQRIATRLSQVTAELETVLQLASTACFGGASFGEGGKGASIAGERLQNTVNLICQQILEELLEEGLTTSSETFLEWQRPYIEAHITSKAPILHSL